jgi:hypothetical protein
MDFIFYIKKASQIQIFGILEPLVEFIFNFEVYNLGLKTFKKLSLHTNSLEKELFKSF